MKNLPVLFLLLFAFGCSEEAVKTKETTAYITDNDFNIQVVSWETFGDITNDGITQNILIEKGTGGNIVFKKANGEIKVTDLETEFANKSINGLLIFNSYWDDNPKIINFTVNGKYTIEYDSKKDSQSGRYQVSTTTAYYTKL